MKRIISLIGLIIVAALGTILLLPYLLSADAIRSAMTERIEAATGRQVTFSGPASLSVFPALNVSVSDVTVANAPGFGDEPLAATDEVSATVRLMPLLAGNVEFDRLTLVRPRFNLATDEQGRGNWLFGDKLPAGGDNTAPAADTGQVSGPGIAFDEFVIEDGAFTFRHGGGDPVEISGIDTVVTWPSSEAPLAAEGTFTWYGETAEFELQCDDPVALASRGTSPASFKIVSDGLTADMTGRFSTAVDFAVDGQIGLRVPSVPALTERFGVTLPVSSGFRDLSLNAKFVSGGTKLSFSDVVLSMDGNAAEGAMVVRFAEPRPSLQATLALSTLDLNPYTQDSGDSSDAAGAGNGAGAQRGDWSDAALPFDGLGGIDADMRISASKIIARSMPLGSGALTVTLKDRVLTAQVAQLQAYGGEINGSLTMNAAQQMPRAALSGSAQNADLLPLLRDTASFERLRGTGNLALDLSGAGTSMKAIIDNLAGTARISAADGALLGIDVVAMIRTLRERELSGWSGGEDRETPFEQFQASFTLESGTARNEDLRLAGPSLDVTGQGTINLPRRTLDYRVNAALVERTGSGDTEQVQTLARIPAIVRGPWDDPLILPDPVAMLDASPEARETLEKAADALKRGDLDGAADAIKEKGVGGLLDALTGRGGKPE